MKLTQSTPLEQSIVRLHTDNTENREWFYGTVVNILEDDRLPYFTKTDRLADAFLNLEAKIAYIKEQVALLQQLKRQLEASRSKAKEEVAKALTHLGVEKLEGVRVSSITVTPAKETSKTRMRILDEDALIKAGYFTVTVDNEAVEQALYSADRRHEVEAYVDVSIEQTRKPESIRINKRRSSSTEPVQIEAA